MSCVIMVIVFKSCIMFVINFKVNKTVASTDKVMSGFLVP